MCVGHQQQAVIGCKLQGLFTSSSHQPEAGNPLLLLPLVKLLDYTPEWSYDWTLVVCKVSQVENRWCWPIIIWQSLLLLILSYSGGFPADVIYIHNKSAGTNLEIAFRVIALRYSTAEFLHNGSHILMPYAVCIIIMFDVCLRWSTNTLWIKDNIWPLLYEWPNRYCTWPIRGTFPICLFGDCNSLFSIYPAIQLQLVISAVPIISWESRTCLNQFHTCEMGVHWMDIWTIYCSSLCLCVLTTAASVH